MTSDDKRAERRVPVALRIRLRYSDVDQFISKFAINISRGGMFLSSRNPKPVGTHLQFEMRLADDSPVIEGTGEVRWIREYDRHQPNQPHGMGIRFYELKPDSLVILERIIEHRRAVGEPDTDSIPVPRAHEPPAAVGIPPVGSVVTQPIRLDGVPEPVPRSERSPRESEAESNRMTPWAPHPAVDAVRPDSGEAHGHRPARGPDQPSPPRDLVSGSRGDRSGGTAAAEPGPAGGVDGALARARRVAGALVRDAGELERELAALLEPVEVPLEGSVDVASRDLAARLGGEPVARRAPAGASGRRASNGELAQSPAEAEAARAAASIDDTGGSVRVDPADVLEEVDAASAQDVDMSDFASENDIPTSVGEPGEPPSERTTPRAGRGRGRTARG